MRESALYNYFASKDALFDALILADQHTKIERLSPLADGPITDGRAVLEQLAIATLESFAAPREQQLFRILMSDGIRLAKVGRINLYERMGNGRERLHDIMRRLIREGWLRDGRPADAGDGLRQPADRLAPPARDRRRPADDQEPARVRPAARRSVPAAAPRPPSARRAPAPPRARPRGTPPHRHAAPATTASVPVRSKEHRSCLASLRSVIVVAALATSACDRADATAGRAPAEAAAVSVSAAHGGRAADHALHPRQRHAHRAGRRRGGRRDRRPRRRHAGRARQPRGGQRRPDAHCRRRSRGAGRARRRPTPRRSRRGSASPTAAPSTSSACPKWPTRARRRCSRAPSSSAPRCCTRRKLLSQSEFDQRSAQIDAAERQYDVARNGAAQQYQSLMAARARVTAGAEGARRHRGARAVRRRGRRAVRRRSAITSRAAPRWRR